MKLQMNENTFKEAMEMCCQYIFEQPATTDYDGVFIVAGFAVPSYLKRSPGKDDKGEVHVASKYASVRDRRDDARIKLRAAKEATAAAEQAWAAFEAAFKKANGNLAVKLIDLADKEATP